MAQQQLRTTIEKLADHLLSNILIRVPARTLAQMRSVSKPLNALISQPSFIKSHLHRSIKTNDEILLVFQDYLLKEVTAHPSISPHLELPNFIKLSVGDYESDGYICHELMGAVNGLICHLFTTHNDYLVQIWNPSISAFLQLPLPGVTSESSENSFRFGFDPYNDDYKVVRLAMFPRLVEVFSLRKGCWELIAERFPAHLFVRKEDGMRCGDDRVCGDGHDGRVHWLCHHEDDIYLETIVAFDLGAERMSEIGLPVVNKKDRRNVLGVLGGKLCLMSCLKDHNCEVWLMNEYGNPESWVKHHVFSQFSANNMIPFGFTLSNEFLFTSFDVLSLYDPVAAKVKSFMFKVWRDAKIVPYVDSLVWITPDKHKNKS